MPAAPVDVRALPAPTADHPGGPAPFVPRDPAGYAKRNDPGLRPQDGLRLAAVPAEKGASASPSPLIATTTTFTMTDHDSQVAAFGSAHQDTEPPDTQVAASSTRVVEFNNNSGAIYDRVGTRLSFFDLYSLFAVPAGYSFTDPRLLYDPASGRFVASGLAFVRSNNNSIVYVMVSQTGDPGGLWTRYTVPAPQTTTQYDQPKVGVSTDKVVISWNDQTGLPPNTFAGSETWVLSYTRMLTGAPTPSQFFAPDTSKFSPVPAHQLTAQTKSWVAYNAGVRAGIMSISGDPLVTGVTSHWDEFAIPSTFNPPSAQQPGGTIDAGDDRSISAAFRNGKVWMTNNDYCIPAGDTVARACLRLTQYDVSGASVTMPQNFDVYSPGWYLYYAAVTIDGNNDVFFPYSRSNASTFAFAQVSNQLGTAPPFSVSGSVTFKTGEATYGASRWGDYCGAGPDPASDSNRVWVACQYAKTAGTSNRNWGTAAANVAP